MALPILCDSSSQEFNICTNPFVPCVHTQSHDLSKSKDVQADLGTNYHCQETAPADYPLMSIMFVGIAVWEGAARGLGDSTLAVGPVVWEDGGGVACIFYDSLPISHWSVLSGDSYFQTSRQTGHRVGISDHLWGLGSRRQHINRARATLLTVPPSHPTHTHTHQTPL